MNPKIDSQEMRNYLLGALQADRRMELEERILSDPEVYEELLVIEEELIDQYVAGGLSKLEQHQFETHFLITAERQKNLRFGKLLKRYVNSHRVPVPQETPELTVRQIEKTAPAKKSLPFPLWPFRSGPALAFSAAILLCFGIVLFCWFAGRRPVTDLAQQGASNFVVVTLTPGSTRSEGTTKRFNAPPKGVNVKLELELSNTSFNNYKSQLFRESEELLASDKLKMESKGEQHVVPVTIAGEILSPGDYQVRLSGVLESGENEFIDNYSFRVIE